MMGVVGEGGGVVWGKVGGGGGREVVGDTYLIRTAIGKVCPASTSNLMMTFRAWPCLRPWVEISCMFIFSLRKLCDEKV